MDFHDPVSGGTHLSAAAFAVFATLVLLRLSRAHPFGHRLAVLLFGLGIAFLYAASGLFHSLRFDSASELEFFRRLDLTAIFALVVGSELPFFAYLLRGRLRVACVVAVTVLAAVGVVAMWAAATVSVPVMIGVYAGLAAVGLLPLRVYARRMGGRGAACLLAAVGVYAVGGVCELAKWPVLLPGVFGPHELLHVTDMLGTLTHFAVVVRFVLPVGTRENPRVRSLSSGLPRPRRPL